MSTSRSARWRPAAAGASVRPRRIQPPEGSSMSSIGPVELFIVIVIAIVVAVLVLREIGKRGR
jgi:hypothetical protein